MGTAWWGAGGRGGITDIQGLGGAGSQGAGIITLLWRTALSLPQPRLLHNADGVRFMPVSASSHLYRLSNYWGFTAYAISLGSSYFQVRGGSEGGFAVCLGSSYFQVRGGSEGGFSVCLGSSYFQVWGAVWGAYLSAWGVHTSRCGGQ